MKVPSKGDMLSADSKVTRIVLVSLYLRVTMHFGFSKKTEKEKEKLYSVTCLAPCYGE